MRTKELFYWIKERYSISQKKADGKPKPWTTDPILQQYRFCNVHREDDTVTQWIRTNWREPHDDDPNLWFAMAVARFVNWPATLAELGYPSPWKPAKFLSAMERRRTAGEKVWSGAYMVRSENKANSQYASKAAYLEDKVLNPLWAVRKTAPQSGTLADLYAWLMPYYGMGSFMAAQVVADVKYQTRWRGAPDWDNFAAPGPGSQRGLNIVFERPVDTPWKPGEWYAHLMQLKPHVDKFAAANKIPPIYAQDLQNCLCELFKMHRGTSRSKYYGV